MINKEKVYEVLGHNFEIWDKVSEFGSTAGCHVCVSCCSYKLKKQIVGMSTASLLESVSRSKNVGRIFVLYVLDGTADMDSVKTIDFLHREANVPYQVYNPGGNRMLKPANTVWSLDFFERNFSSGSSIVFFDSDDILTGPAAIDNSVLAKNNSMRIATISTAAKLDNGEYYINKAVNAYGGRSLGYDCVTDLDVSCFLTDDGSSVITTMEDVSLAVSLDSLGKVIVDNKSNEYLALVGIYGTRHNYLVPERSYQKDEKNRFSNRKNRFCSIAKMITLNSITGSITNSIGGGPSSEIVKRKKPKWI